MSSIWMRHWNGFFSMVKVEEFHGGVLLFYKWFVKKSQKMVNTVWSWCLKQGVCNCQILKKDRQNLLHSLDRGSQLKLERVGMVIYMKFDLFPTPTPMHLLSAVYDGFQSNSTICHLVWLHKSLVKFCIMFRISWDNFIVTKSNFWREENIQKQLGRWMTGPGGCNCILFWWFAHALLTSYILWMYIFTHYSCLTI